MEFEVFISEQDKVTVAFSLVEVNQAIITILLPSLPKVSCNSMQWAMPKGHAMAEVG